MIVLENGTVYLEKGERMPHRCECGAFIPFEENKLEIVCWNCGKTGEAEEFSAQYEFRISQ